ncbi:ATP-binding cassette domain-containing protein [Xenorhabdus sp. XENO-1]|uniref:ABC transporter ATP-binding protein n=1 Tax=Xenorhabdus bovienii TaxID=40576 RepID=UPI0020CA836B|nr:ATP-binding cassette domain-containing protein [Xenorhabdus bovienii]MCP9268818.1 ATP-binding cassette domain-containing protein [Xenorhabdus bovienii subsp. africana]
MSIIQVNNLCKSYEVYTKSPGLLGSLKSFIKREYAVVEAVKSINFSIDKGEIVGFLGANGAGKTTTMKMLTGIIKPSSGYIQVLGYTPYERKNEYLKSITFVAGQKQQLAWDLTPNDSFILHKVIYSINEKEFLNYRDELVEMLSLSSVIDRPVRHLSLGERMKCELSLSLLHKPSVLFLDEPTIGLDVNMQRSVREFIAYYNQINNATILLTSHYMADVEALAKRVIIINSGRIVYDGKLSHLIKKRSPKNILKATISGPIKPELIFLFMMSLLKRFWKDIYLHMVKLMLKQVRRSLLLWWVLIGQSFSRVIAYRAQSIIWLLGGIMPIAVMFVWLGLAKEGEIGGYTASDFAVHFLSIYLVRQLTAIWVMRRLDRDIRRGELSMLLLRPVSPLYNYVSDHVGEMMVRGPIISLVFISRFSHKIN